MLRIGLLGAGALTLVLAGSATTGPVRAQEEDAEAAAVTADDAAAVDPDLLDEDELDSLVAPVALYPDSLLAQVLVAATYPLDLVKADRFVEENAETPEAERGELAEAEDWDPSVQVLAAGFPTVVERMADEIEWTEQLGEAMLGQTDGLLDAIQRMRDRALATGYLDDNEAQVVEQDGDSISIEPADPEVVYVPSYDPAMAFTAAPTAAPVVYDSGTSTTDLLTTGAIAFGSAMILGEIFDDEDDDWDDYWRGPPAFDWDDGDFYPGRDVDFDGDINIDRGDREINIDRDRVDIDRNELNIDRDRVNNKIGSIDRDNIDIGKEGAWKPSEDRQQAARDKLAARKQSGDGAKTKEAREKLKKRGNGDGDAARAKLSKAAADRKPQAKKPGKKEAALKARPEGKKPEGKKKAKKAADRGEKSVAKQKKPKPKAASAKPKNVTKASKGKPKAKKAPKKQSAMKKPHGGAKAKKAKSRGGNSNNKRKRR